MRILIASVEPDEVATAADYGAAGIITNPTVLAQSGRDWREKLAHSATLIDGPIHIQLTEETRETMLPQAEEFQRLADNRFIAKICVSREGLAVAQQLKKQGTKVNMTAVATVQQAILAAGAGADFVSVYLGRSERFGDSGVKLVGDIAALCSSADRRLSIIAASLKHARHLYEAAMAGAEFGACPATLIEEVSRHPITDSSIEGFRRDWSELV